LTPPLLRRTLASTMPAGFDAEGKKLLRGLPREAEPFTRDFQANENFYLSPAYRCAGLDRQIDALGDVFYALTPRSQNRGRTGK